MMIKMIAALGMVAALASPSLAQNMDVTCDAAGMEKLKSDAQTVKKEYEVEAKAAIGDATIAMQAGDMEKCTAAMQKAMMAIHNSSM